MTGRETSYSEEMAQRICTAVASSQHGLRKTLEENGLPPLTTVQSWLREHAFFQSAYAQAKREQIEAMAEDIVDLSNDDTLEPNDKRIRIDTRKWLLSKLIPKTYGDKLDVTSGGEALPQNSTLIDQRIQSIIMQAQQRQLRQQGGDELPPEAQALLE